MTKDEVLDEFVQLEKEFERVFGERIPTFHVAPVEENLALIREAIEKRDMGVLDRDLPPGAKL